MYHKSILCFFITCLFTCIIFIQGCSDKKDPQKDAIADTPRELQVKTSGLIRQSIRESIELNERLPDSTKLHQPRLVRLFYERTAYTPVWSHEQKWLSPGDSLMQMIRTAQFYGLFPEDYHVRELTDLHLRFANDSLEKGDRKDASLWSKADLLLTDAFLQVVHDVKLGRLPQDSLTQRKDSVLADEFYLQQFNQLQKSFNLTAIIETLEPKQRGYHLLKHGIRKFLDSSDHKQYTFVTSPSKDQQKFKRSLQKRLYEGGYISYDSIAADSAQLAEAVKKFQKEKGIAVDGRAGEGTIRSLNVSDRERFIRIAISMDKYKMLPEQMPERYIWVNASANNLEVIEGDTVKLFSKVICGKPRTRTPLLTSLISELITYPQWVPPPSIVLKEILPAVKKNPGYLARKGFSLVDSKGNEVDPYTVDWTKYSRSIPYRVVQGSGDANALGIMKFVFSNKYSVYLHDTNQRYLFGNAMRSLSHGCVRVQEWEKLAHYIIHTDSINNGRNSNTRIDSMKVWLQNKQKRSIALRNKMPVYIRYITCEGKDGGIVFYDVVYGEDKMLREKYFAVK